MSLISFPASYCRTLHFACTIHTFVYTNTHTHTHTLPHTALVYSYTPVSVCISTPPSCLSHSLHSCLHSSLPRTSPLPCSLSHSVSLITLSSLSFLSSPLSPPSLLSLSSPLPPLLSFPLSL